MWKWGKAITDVPGVKVGHSENYEAKTGCTVALFENGAVAGVDVRGSAPGTREIESIKLVRLVGGIHGVLFTGGSAFGLDATGGVMKYLEERDIGYDVGVAKIPIVPTAVIFDLRVGSADVRPDAGMGYEAASNASKSAPEEGLHGVGIGASAGGISGEEKGRGGFGTASIHIGGNVTVGSMVVANPLGNVVDPFQNKALVGSLDRSKWINPKEGTPWIEQTVLALVVTNAALSKEEATKVAQMAQDGIARAIIPAHTMYDGDISIAASTGGERVDVNKIGDAAAESVSRAIVRGISISNGIEIAEPPVETFRVGTS